MQETGDVILAALAAGLGEIDCIVWPDKRRH
jgi:hypothetical protein